MWAFLKLDKTKLDLLSLLLAGTGIFSVLTKFNSPELNKAYVGANPHAVKRDVIETATNWLLILTAVSGMLVQAVSMIRGDSIPARIHSTEWYVKAFAIGLAFIVPFTILVGKLGRLISKAFWRKAIGQLYGQNLSYLHFNIGLDGDLSEIYAAKEGIPPEGRVSFRAANQRSAQRMLQSLEDLLEARSIKGDWVERLRHIDPYVRPYVTDEVDEE